MTCLANNFLATLSTTQQSSVVLTLSSTNATQYWSNLPTTMVARRGIALSALTATQKAAAETLLAAALTAQGQTTMGNLRTADEYLKNNGGGSGYGGDLYYIAFLGTPSTTGPWILEFTGHHYTFFYAVGANNTPTSLTPNFVGVEPVNYSGGTPMAAEQSAMRAVLAGLDSSQLATRFARSRSPLPLALTTAASISSNCW